MLSTYSVKNKDMYHIYFNDVECVGLIKISPKLSNKVDVQSGSGAKKGSITFQGRELAKVQIQIQIPYLFEDEEDVSFEEQDLRICKVISLLFPEKIAGTSAKVVHPLLNQMGLFELACLDVSCEHDGQGDNTKTYSFECVEYVPKSKVKSLPATSPEGNSGDQYLKSDIKRFIEKGMSEIEDP